MSVKTELKLAYLKDTKNLIKNAIIEKGQDVSDSDTFRSYAEKILAIAGGGSGEGTSINTEGLTVIFPVTELTAVAEMDGMAPIMTPLGLTVGDICLVDWNGVGYISETKMVDLDGIPLVGIGNTAAMGGADTGEPFAIAEIPEELTAQAGGACGLVAPFDGSTTFKVGIYRIGKSAGTVLEDLPVALDFSNGNQTLTAPDGYLVKSAIIEKPANLVPENVMSGVDIAGIVGTAVAGGGGSKKLRVYKNTLSKSSSSTRVSEEICLATENDPFFVAIFKTNTKPFAQTNSNDRTFLYAYAFDTNYTVSKSDFTSTLPTRQVAYREGMIGMNFVSNTQTGLLDPIDTTGLTGENAIMHQGDIYFHRNADGRGFIDVGLPFSSDGSITYKWNISDQLTVIALFMED